MIDYPKRTICRHCDHPLSQADPDAQWLDPWGGRECPEAPNPEDGPMPPHEPGAVVVSPLSPRICTAIAAKDSDTYGQCGNSMPFPAFQCDRAANHV